MDESLNIDFNKFNANDSVETAEFKLLVKAEIEKSLKNFDSKEKGQEWLIHLHKTYTDRFLKDNDRIWLIGSIFIPLSLLGLAGVKDASVLTILPLGLGSILIMYFWVVFAEHHRAFQNVSLAIVKAIEEYLGFQVSLPKLGGHPITRKINVQKLRWRMYYFIIALWISALAVACINYFL